MKYELKRKIKSNMLGYGGILVLTLILSLVFESAPFMIMTIICAGFLINEMIRSKEEPLIFDDNGFSIGDEHYNYCSIERIDTARYRGYTSIKIIVDGEPVYRFDSSYENSKEFFRLLTLKGIEHDLLGR